MKTIKFVTDELWQKKFAAAVRNNVNNYFKENGISTKGNFMLLTQTVSMLFLYIAPFITILVYPMSIWLALLLVIVMGIATAGVGMCVMHDAVHGSYSSKDWVNKFMGGTMYLLGSDVFTWKVQHNIMHHAYTNIDGYDEDISTKGPIRLSQFLPLKKVHRYQYIDAFFFYGMMTILKLTNDFKQLALYNKEGITRNYHINPRLEYIKMILVKGVYLFTLIGLPILFTSFSWWQVLLGFIILHWTAGCILSTIFQMAHVVEGAQQFRPDDQGIIHSRMGGS